MSTCAGSMAATTQVIWLCACVRYWPDRGLVFECVTCFYCCSLFEARAAHRSWCLLLQASQLTFLFGSPAGIIPWAIFSKINGKLAAEMIGQKYQKRKLRLKYTLTHGWGYWKLIIGNSWLKGDPGFNFLCTMVLFTKFEIYKKTTLKHGMRFLILGRSIGRSVRKGKRKR